MDQFNFNDFPNSNFNEVNLDWLLSLVQQLTELVESGRYGVPAGGSTGQVLGKLGPDDFNTGWIDQTGGGGGTSNYAQLTNKPQINGVELLGNKTAAQLNLVAAQAGMGLSQNSFTNEEKVVLDSLYFVDQSNTYAQLETAYTAGKKILFFESGELFPVMLHPTNQFWFLHPILNGGMRSVSITTTQNWSFRTEANPLSAVRYVSQTLTETQKAQARENIGAVSTGDYNPDEKTAAMTQSVGKDSSGKLWTTPGSGGDGLTLLESIEIAEPVANIYKTFEPCKRVVLELTSLSQNNTSNTPVVLWITFNNNEYFATKAISIHQTTSSAQGVVFGTQYECTAVIDTNVFGSLVSCEAFGKFGTGNGFLNGDTLKTSNVGNNISSVFMYLPSVDIAAGFKMNIWGELTT